MPLRPLQAIDEVRVLSADGDPTIIATANYLADTASTPPRLVHTGAIWPQPGQAANGIEIDFTAGYGDAAADVPAPHPPGAAAARRALVRAPRPDRDRRRRHGGAERRVGAAGALSVVRAMSADTPIGDLRTRLTLEAPSRTGDGGGGA